MAGKIKATVGLCEDDIKGELRDLHPKDTLDEMMDRAVLENAVFTNPETVPAATWAVFTFTGARNAENMAQGYARILTEWFPASGHTRRVDMPHLERFTAWKAEGEESWEIWMPVGD